MMEVLDGDTASDDEIERLTRRIEMLETIIKRLEQNTAPTVPQYDLGGGED